MKKILIGSIVAVVSIIIVFQPVVMGSLLTFAFLGVIPGTSIQIPFWIMSLAYLTASFLLILWLKSQPFFFGNLEQQELVARRLARQKITSKNRYSPERIAARKHYVTSKKIPIRRSA